MSHPAAPRSWPALLPAALCLILSIHLVRTTIFPAPDELEHVSYAAALAETGHLVPRFETQVTLDRTDFAAWTTRPNYIGHPSPYYVFIAQFLDRSLPPQRAVLAPRFASLALLFGGLAIALGAGWRSFAADRPALLIFASMLMLCPEALSVAGQVNNDALGILGGGLAYAGVLWLSRPGPASRGLVAAATGLTLALWAKPNAGLGVGVFLGVAWLLLRPPGTRPSLRVAASLVAGGLLGALPTLMILHAYGAVVPVTAEGIWDVRSMGGFWPYLPAFALNLGWTWGFLKTGAWPIQPVPASMAIPVFWAMIACAVTGAWIARRRWTDPAAIPAIAGVSAFLVVLPIHLWFNATHLGYSLPAASFRYYLPLWPALAHALGWAVLSAAPRWRSLVIGVCAASLAAGWLP